MEQTFAEFAEKNLLSLSYKETELREGEEWCPGVRAYRVKIKSPLFDGKIKVRWKCGPACGAPDILDVLNGIQFDCSSGEETIEDFCDNYGYSISEALTVHAQCVKYRNKVERYFGPFIFEQFMHCYEE